MDGRDSIIVPTSLREVLITATSISDLRARKTPSSRAVDMSQTARVILLLLACATFAGCRSDPSVALLESEMRWLEDQYYALEGQYQLKCEELESCRLAHQANDVSSHGSASETNAERSPSSRRNGGTRPEQSPPIEPPRVDGLPDLSPQSGAMGPSVLELPAPQGSGVRPSSYSMPIDTTVTHILLNRQLTGGYDRDGHPGDEGVMVVIEPRNAEGQFVPILGEVTIKLIDPSIHTPDRQTFAQWKLTPRQASGKMRRSLLGRGVHLELAWPASPPKADEFELQVSYRTSGGKQLTSKRTIHIDPPRDASARWTPISDDHGDSHLGNESQSQPAHISPESATRLPATELRSQALPQNNAVDGPLPRWSPHR